MHCTQCGAEGSGRFCGPCGASLVELPCQACDAVLPPGTRFCTECGTPLRSREGAISGAPAGAGFSASPSLLPWTVSGVLLVLLLVVGGVSILSPGDATGGAPPGAPAGALGPAPNVDLASMTPGEAARRLFNRVAGALERQDSAEVADFLPMAIDAHEIARPLDDLQLFRLSFLYRVAVDPEAALAVATEGLERSPDHVLLLSAAAEAYRALGDEDAARAHYARLLEVWEAETAREDETYDGFDLLLPVLREDAERYLARP